MSHTMKLTKYVANFVDELYCSGVRHVVISPGSRSTPLAYLFSEHDGFNVWVLIDERSAAFFALGLARETNSPVALVCTSGTAAANYYPAIIEAYTQRIPLIVLTADRPHELRDVGAPQTINQIHLYGDFVKWFQEMALPDDREEMLYYVRSRAARAVFESLQVGNPGPVHMNFPFREPLVPDVLTEHLWGKHTKDKQRTHYPVLSGKKQLHEAEIAYVKRVLFKEQNGVIVCGPQFDTELSQHVVALSEKLNVPILADPLSQLRAGEHSKKTIIDGYDTIFREQKWRQKLKPSFIIRFGAMPTSKSYLHYVTEHNDIPHFIVEDDMGVREPTNNPTHFILANSQEFCQHLIQSIPRVTSSSWLATWKKLNGTVQHHIRNSSSSILTEGEAVRELLEIIPDKSTLFVSNSMPVRDLDTFFMATDKRIQVYANRGVSGIDGINSTALGIAAANPSKRVTLIVGDLSFYHDLTGLLAAKKYALNITILLINNDGGGIFSFLPQANEKKHFEALFGTPLHLDFANVVAMYGGSYQLAKSRDSLREMLEKSYHMKGLSVIEIQTNREENAKWHRTLWKNINEELNLCD